MSHSLSSLNSTIKKLVETWKEKAKWKRDKHTVALTTKDFREGEAREREKEAGRERRGAGRPVKGLGRGRDWEKGLELEEKALGLEEMRAAADEVAEQAISLTHSHFAVKENMGEGEMK